MLPATTRSDMATMACALLPQVQSFARPFELQDDNSVTCSLDKLVESYKPSLNSAFLRHLSAVCFNM